MAKRANGEGTLSPRKDKSGKVTGWKGAVTVGYLENGREDRRWASGKTQAEVREKLEALKTARNGGMLAAHGVPTVAAYLDDWLSHLEAQGKARNTLSDYRRVIEKRLKPALGKKPLDKLSVLDLERSVSGVVKAVSGSEGQRTLKVMRQALTQAVRWQLIPRNVGEAVTMPRVVKVEMLYWEASEALRFLEHARESRLYALFYTALTLGLRSGELRGLRWQDVDFTGGWMHIRQKANDLEHGEVVLETTLKTDASKRRIKLEAGVMAVFEAHRERLTVTRAQIETPSSTLERRRTRQGIVRVWAEHDLAFPTENGTPFSASNLRRVFNAVCDAAQVKRIRLHDLRHTAATAMIRRGYPPKLVADILGHTDPAFTLREYAHVWEEQREEYAPSAENLYGHSSKVLELSPLN